MAGMSPQNRIGHFRHSKAHRTAVAALRERFPRLVRWRVHIPDVADRLHLDKRLVDVHAFVGRTRACQFLTMSQTPADFGLDVLIQAPAGAPLILPRGVTAEALR